MFGAGWEGQRTVTMAAEQKAGFRRALVVDDEGGLQLLVRAVLEHGSYMVDVARNGCEACDRIRTNQYDAIVCDLLMPQMDGATFFRALKELDEEQAGRVIFVTGASLDLETRAQIRESGRPILRKPFDIDELERAVNAVAQAAG
jgi:CheY-like chemotaxis protein